MKKCVCGCVCETERDVFFWLKTYCRWHKSAKKYRILATHSVALAPPPSAHTGTHLHSTSVSVRVLREKERGCVWQSSLWGSRADSRFDLFTRFSLRSAFRCCVHLFAVFSPGGVDGHGDGAELTGGKQGLQNSSGTEGGPPAPQSGPTSRTACQGKHTPHTLLWQSFWPNCWDVLCQKKAPLPCWR